MHGISGNATSVGWLTVICSLWNCILNGICYVSGTHFLVTYYDIKHGGYARFSLVGTAKLSKIKRIQLDTIDTKEGLKQIKLKTRGYQLNKHELEDCMLPSSYVHTRLPTESGDVYSTTATKLFIVMRSNSIIHILS